jgi:hypothetical protein
LGGGGAGGAGGSGGIGGAAEVCRPRGLVRAPRAAGDAASSRPADAREDRAPGRDLVPRDALGAGALGMLLK